MRSPCYSVSFISFSLRFCSQRKAAKDFCYQDLLDAFSFEEKAPKEKALQKENGRICGLPQPIPATAFEKAVQNFLIVKSEC